jgi:hypothetical protein
MWISLTRNELRSGSSSFCELVPAAQPGIIALAVDGPTTLERSSPFWPLGLLPLKRERRTGVGPYLRTRHPRPVSNEL